MFGSVLRLNLFPGAFFCQGSTNRQDTGSGANQQWKRATARHPEQNATHTLDTNPMRRLRNMFLLLGKHKRISVPFRRTDVFPMQMGRDHLNVLINLI